MSLAWLAEGIPDDLRQHLAGIVPGALQVLACPPGGGWLVVGAHRSSPAGYAARGIPDACFVKIGEFVRAGHVLRCVAFPPAFEPGSAPAPLSAAARPQPWLVVSDQGFAASGIPPACFDALTQAWAAGVRPTDVAFLRAETVVDSAGEGVIGWAILAGAAVRGEGVPGACRQALVNLAQGLRPALHVAFAPGGSGDAEAGGGGWVVATRDRICSHGLPDACLAHMAQVGQAHHALRTVLMPGGGWWVGSNRAKTALPADPLCEFELRFRLVNGRWRSLLQRMETHGVKRVGVTLTLADELAWSTTYGDADALANHAGKAPADTDIDSATDSARAALHAEIAEALTRLYGAEGALELAPQWLIR